MRRSVAVVFLFLFGCGSGGGGGGGGVQQGTLAVDLATRGGTAQTVIYAVELTVRLPAGVTVAADAQSGAVAGGVLQVRDGGAWAAARYLPATAGAAASVVLNIADPYGFPVGELATLVCQDQGGAVPEGSRVEHFSARDQNGAVMEGMWAGVSARRP